MAGDDDSSAPKLPTRSLKDNLKTPKGTRDWSGPSMVLREQVFSQITDVFKRHGGMALDTPVFELKDVLSGKYGEDSKLIYDLKDQGGEECSLRYDLTVPFARWLAQNKVEQVKRYHIAKVYRRDQPAIARGRFREFHQCDFDIAGKHDPMIPDAEVLSIIAEVMEVLRLDVTIKINHRRILDGMFAVCGVPSDKTRPISSAVDKLDKETWENVKQEMCSQKGLPEEVADRIGEYVKHKGSLREVVEFLRADEKLQANDDVKAGTDDMALLAKYMEALGVSDKLSLDLSLARGLDYYTGVIYEVILNGSPPNTEQTSKPKKKEDTQVGSIAAGGRYDNLVGMYGKKMIPCVGISFGVDRMFGILEARQLAEEGQRESLVDVYVMGAGDADSGGLLLERMKVARLLWKAGIRAGFQPKVKAKLVQQFKAAGDTPWGVILGEKELAEGKVQVRRLGLDKDGKKDDGKLVSMDSLVDEVRRLL